MTTGHYNGMFVYHGRVQFYDCDPMGVVWHGHYLKFMEEARHGLLFEIGYDYDMIREEDFYDLPVIEINFIKYIRPLRAGDAYDVILLIRECGVRLVFDYVIGKGDTVCVKARTTQCAVNRKTGAMEFQMPERLANHILGACSAGKFEVRPYGCYKGGALR